MKNLFTHQLLASKIDSLSSLGNQLFTLSTRTFALFLFVWSVSIWAFLLTLKTYGWDVYYEQQMNQAREKFNALVGKHQLTSAAIHSRQQLLTRFEQLIPASDTFDTIPIREPLALLNRYRERIGFTLMQAKLDENVNVPAHSATNSGAHDHNVFAFQLRGSWQQFEQLFTYLNEPHQPLIVTQLLIERLEESELQVSLRIKPSSNTGPEFNQQWLAQQKTLNNVLQTELNEITDIFVRQLSGSTAVPPLLGSNFQSKLSATVPSFDSSITHEEQADKATAQPAANHVTELSPFHIQKTVYHNDNENCVVNHRPAIQLKDTSFSELAFRGIEGQNESMQAIIEKLPEQRLILLNLNQWAFSPPLKLVNIEADKLTFNAYQFDHNCFLINLDTRIFMPKSARTMD